MKLVLFLILILQVLANIIKNQYSSCLLDNSQKPDDEEFYKISVILNKEFPDYFLSLIKTPKGNISVQQKFLNEKILSTIEHWHTHSTQASEDEIRDIASAFYITARRLHPELNIYIPGRTKSTRSSVSKISKEILRNISLVIPSNLSDGISDKDFVEQINLNNTDFSGLTIVLDHTEDTIHFDRSDPKNIELFNLRKKRDDNIDFLHHLEASLERATNFSNIDLLQIKITLLMKLRESTYDECSEEFHGTSFAKLLKKSIDQYLKSSTKNNYKVRIDEIYELMDELKTRIQDRFQTKLLETYIPEILNDELFTKTLKVKYSFAKSIKKRNGFCSWYYYLETADGKKIEMQAQSKKRFEINKQNHSDLSGKEIDVFQFFEPTDPNCDKETFNSYIDLLNNTPIFIRNSLYKSANRNLSQKDRKLKRKLEIAESSVKLKEKFEFVNTHPDGNKTVCTIPLEKYLPMYAEYVSPKLFAISSPHTRFNKSVTSYSKKSIVSGFTDVLLKHDATTCLAEKLIDKLEEIISSPKHEVTLNGINKRAIERFSVNNSLNDGR